MAVHINRLPNEILVKIFNYLSLEDLALSIQFVCEHWKAVSYTEELWDNITYYPNEDTSEKEIVTFLKKTPKLRRFRFDGIPQENTIFPALLYYCEDIRSWQVEFMPTLTLDQLDSLLTKYSKLESLMIRIESPNEKELVNKISTCHNLKSLTLTGQCCIPGIFKPIVDGCSSLQHLSFGGGSPNVSKEDLLYVLRNMKDRLISLHFSYSPTTSYIIELLGNFSKLEKIYLHDASHDVPLNLKPLGKLKSLKSLEFHSFTEKSQDLFDVAFSGGWPLLEKFDLCFFDQEYDKKNINNIFLSFPNLKFLGLYGKNPEGALSEMKNIHKLKKLEKLRFSPCYSFSEDFVEALALCLNLKVVDLRFSNTDIIEEYTKKLKARMPHINILI